MTTMNISLPDELKEFVEEQLSKGQYASVSEYIRELIRDARKRAAQERLEALLLEGLDSGEPIDVTPEFWNERREELARRVAARGKSPEPK